MEREIVRSIENKWKEKAKLFWIKHEQGKAETTDNFRQQQSILPSDRAAVIRPFQVIGTDFAGSIMYYNKNKGEKKTHTSFNPYRPNPGQRGKIKLNFCFHTSL